MKKTASHRKARSAPPRPRKRSAEIEEPGRTPGSAEGERDPRPDEGIEEPGRTPGSAEGE